MILRLAITNGPNSSNENNSQQNTDQKLPSYASISRRLGFAATAHLRQRSLSSFEAMPTPLNHVERLRAVMNFQPVDRLPRWPGTRSPRHASKPSFSRSRFHVEAPNRFGYGAILTRSRG